MGLSAHKEQFYHQLTTLLEAGLSIQAATQHLSAQRRQRLPEFSAALAQGTAAGLTLSEALPKQDVDALERSMLAAAQHGGKLELATRQLSEHFGLQAALWAQIRRSMVYPIIVLHAAIVLPSITVFVTENGSVWREILLPMLDAWIIIAVLWWGGRWFWQQGAWSDGIDSFLNRLPGLGAWRQNLAHARFCQALGLQLQTGDSVVNAVESASRAAATANLKHSGKAHAKLIKEIGCPLGPLLLDNPNFNADLAQILATAEISGRLDEEALERSRKLMDLARISATQSGIWLPKLLYAPIALYAIYRIFQFYKNYLSGLTQGLGL